MNTSKLISRCRFLCTVLSVVFLAVLAAVCIRVSLTNQKQQRLDSLCRGTIYDCAGEVIAYSKAGQQGQRIYNNGEAFSALVGYTSAHHGSDGIERVYNQWLSPSEGDDDHGDIYLTVDSRLQQACYENILCAPVAAAVIMDIDTGAVLAAVDTPSFDPSELDIDYDGIVSRGCVFYNIYASSNITPGEMFLLPSCCAAALSDDTALAEALIGGQITSNDIRGIRSRMTDILYNKLLVGQTIELDCMTLRSEIEPADGTFISDSDYRAALLGYGSARLSPMQVCMYTTALARSDGSIIKPYIVSKAVSRSGNPVYFTCGDILGGGVFNAEAKALVGRLFTSYDSEIGCFSAMTATAVSGNSDNIWLTAYYPAESPEYALTIVMQGARGALGEDDALTAAQAIFDSIN